MAQRRQTTDQANQERAATIGSIRKSKREKQHDRIECKGGGMDARFGRFDRDVGGHECFDLWVPD